MTEENVIDFQERATEKARDKAEAAGAQRLMETEGFRPMAKQHAKGKKVTQQAAFNAMVQMRDLVDGQGAAVQRVTQMMMMFEQTIQRIDMHLGVLMHVLMEKELITEEDWKNGWNKHVVEPEREKVREMADTMCKSEDSKEDIYFGNAILAVMDKEFEDTEIEGEEVTGGALKDFFLNRLLNPQFRRLVLDDLRKHMPELPEFVPETEPVEAVEASQHPDCHYCGKAECPTCNPLPSDDTPDPEPEPEPEPEPAVA